MAGHIVATLALVPYDEQAVRAWLVRQGFAVGDLRGTEFKHPMAWACSRGELNVCKWLYNNGAAADITKANNNGCTPMWIACYHGHLDVCKWLHQAGAAADITKATNTGTTPMYIACQEGHLPVCKWLHHAGAAADITKAANDGFTPMFIACQEGHLPVCKWLFEAGAAADITKANNNGTTPMSVACNDGHLDVCKWLVFNGALSPPPPMLDHVAQDISQRPRLLAWAKQTIATHDNFYKLLIGRSVAAERQVNRVSSRRRCHLTMFLADTLKTVASFLDVEMGRRLRNVREFTASF
jgi:hypothetical protein